MFRKSLIKLSIPLLATPYFLYEPETQLYSWGSNSFGQLGVGHNQALSFPSQVKIPLRISTDAQIFAKGPISGLITQNKFFMWGKNKMNLFNNQSNDCVIIPQEMGIGNLAGIGLNHIGFYDKDKGLLFWGCDVNGKLGKEAENREGFSRRGNTNMNKVSVQINGKILKVGCGKEFSWYLNEDGEVWQWGQKECLGWVSKTDTSQPQKVNFGGIKIKDVDCGQDYMVALTEDGRLFSWGKNKYGQLGQGEVAPRNEPSLISTLSNIKKISCGDYFSAAINDKGELFTWGYGMDGQLSNNSKQNTYVPFKVDFSQKVIEVSCGGGHMGLISDKHELYMVGKGRDGQLGRAEKIESSASYRTLPRVVEYFFQRKVLKVQCGGDHTLALVK